MELWLFFLIFGLVLFVPTIILILVYNRFKNTIVLLVKLNGSLRKIIIGEKELSEGIVTKCDGKPIKPIKIKKEDIYYGKWRRWIIKGELESKNNSVSEKEIEEYLNNEDLIKLYVAGKFKDTLMILLIVVIISIIISGSINGYLTASHICIIGQTNDTTAYFKGIFEGVLYNYTG